jgi:hypothetical protein
MPEPIPEAELIDERECDFLGALAALHELLGTNVTMWVFGGHCDSIEPVLTISACLEGALELDDDGDAPVGFRAGAALLVVGPSSLVEAWRSEYRRSADGATWLVVTLVFEGGTRVEIEEHSS